MVAQSPALARGARASLFLAILLPVTLPADAQSVGPSTEARLVINVSAPTFRPGEAMRIRVSCTCPGPLDRVNGEVFGQTVQFRSADNEWLGLGGIDLATKAGVYTLTVEAGSGASGELHATHSIRVAARAFAVRRLQVSREFVEPSEGDQLRIVREAERLDSIFRAPSTRTWDGSFLRPLMGPVSSNFGARTIFNGESRAPHAGIDFHEGIGTPAAAPSAGRVVLADDLFFTGGTIIIDHGQGLYSLFAHLSEFAAHEGQDVAQGTVVGLVGATGRVTGPHLHWSVRLNGARVDPLSVIEIAKTK